MQPCTCGRNHQGAQKREMAPCTCGRGHQGAQKRLPVHNCECVVNAAPRGDAMGTLRTLTAPTSTFQKRSGNHTRVYPCKCRAGDGNNSGKTKISTGPGRQLSKERKEPRGCRAPSLTGNVCQKRKYPQLDIHLRASPRAETKSPGLHRITRSTGSKAKC